MTEELHNSNKEQDRQSKNYLGKPSTFKPIVQGRVDQNQRDHCIKNDGVTFSVNSDH
jgi:hypothetical protein